jgi:RNA polymerase sigma factor (sigma-70 family)
MMEAGMTGLDDAELMARYATGDQQAARSMYERFAGPLLTVALATLRKRDLADEVVQDTLLKAYERAATYDPAKPLSPWLYTIARRTAVDIYRRESRAATPAEIHDEGAAVDPLSFERTWEAWEVRCALQDLPPEEREVVRLSHLVGLTHSETATHLGVPIGTVKSRSARAHRRLAQRLAHIVGVEA